MGLHDKLRKLKKATIPSSGGGSIELQKRRSSHSLVVPPGQVTEQTLQVWRALPPEIRHDPSMVSFQVENERLHGSSSIPTDDESILPNDIESSHEDDHSCEGSEFINMRKIPKIKINADSKSTDGDGDGDGTPSEKSKSLAFKSVAKQKSQQRRHHEITLKRAGLMVFWLFAATVLMLVSEKHLVEKTLAISENVTKNYLLPGNPTGDFKLIILGGFEKSTTFINEPEDFLIIQPQISFRNEQNNTTNYKNVLEPWQIPINTAFSGLIVSRNLTYKMPGDVLNSLKQEGTKMRLSIYTNIDDVFSMELIYNPLVINVKVGTCLAAMILLIFYGLLVWELFERTFVAIICSILSVAVLACFNDRPNMDEIIQWMDMEMLTLLFSMMIIIGVLTETGVFDYIAVVAFELSRGKIWPMIYSLCFITCFVSGFLDNVTTVLLMTPVAIRLCEVMSLDPVPVIMGIIVHANIGGSLTPIGDPISIIICSNRFIADSGVTFMNFVEHTLPGVVMVAIQSCIYLRVKFHDINSLRLNEPKEIKELRREIRVWQRASNAIASIAKDADLVRETMAKKVKILKRTLRHKLEGVGSTDVYEHTLEELKLKYPIKDRKLLVKACISLMFVLIGFIIQSLPEYRTLPLGWIALLGVILLLLMIDGADMEELMHRIEWTTLLFFAAMFVMMECVERLGLFTWIGEITESIILFVDKDHRLAVAIFIILWISALASAILDSIPVTAMMVKVVVSLVAKETLDVPLQPLVWALAFGSSLGGNGTLYGASSNVISAGIAEQHGYKISFSRYFRTIFPMMLGQLAVITTYLMLAHMIFDWN